MSSNLEVFCVKIQKAFEILALNSDPLVGEAAREWTSRCKEKNITMRGVIETGGPERLLTLHP